MIDRITTNMEYIPRKYKKECDAIKDTKSLPMDWIRQFLEKLYTTNEKFVYPFPHLDYTTLTSTEISFLLILSDVLMEYIIEMDTAYIDKVDSYIQNYRRLLQQVYDHATFKPEFRVRMQSILNLSS